MTLELNSQEVAFLAQQISARIDHLQYELVHTDDRALHRALADDLAKLEALRQRVTMASAA